MARWGASCSSALCVLHRTRSLRAPCPPSVEGLASYGAWCCVGKADGNNDGGWQVITAARTCTLLRMQVSEFIAAAPQQTAVLARTGVVDLTVPNVDAAVAHAIMRAFLAQQWAVEPRAEDCQVLLESFDWHVHGPQPTARRMQHVAAVSSTLNLPRGRHLLRLTIDPHYLHRFTVWSHDAFTLQDAPEVLLQHELLHVLEASDALPEMAAGTWRVGCRHSFYVTKPCRATISFRAAPDMVHHRTRVLLLNNDTLEQRNLVLGEVDLLRMAPNRSGFTIMAIVHTAAATPSGCYRLRLASDEPFADFTAVPSGRCESFAGAYETNRRAIAWQYALTPAVACHVAIKLQMLTPGVAGKLLLETVPVAAVGGKGKGKDGGTPASKESLEEVAPIAEIQVEGDSEIAAIPVPAGRHVLSFRMDRARCAFDILPSGAIVKSCSGGGGEVAVAQSLSGGVGGAPGGCGEPSDVLWTLFLAPTADEKCCPIAKDGGRQALQQAQLREWVERGPGGTKDRAKNGQASLLQYQALKASATETGTPVAVVRPACCTS
jgi:hypothetical protein